MENGRHNFISKRKKRLKLRYFLIISFIFLIILRTAETESEKPSENFSEIKLVISKSKSRLLSYEYKGDVPYKVIINGNEEIFKFKFYDLKEEKNNITLKFNIQIKTCELMFENFNNILEIDLSNFDVSSHKCGTNVFSLRKFRIYKFNKY